MRYWMRRAVAVVAVLVAAGAATPGGAVSAELDNVVDADHAEPEPTESHCVLDVVGQLESGELLTSELVCFESITSALDAAGLGSGIDDLAEAATAMAATSSTIGIHYDLTNFGGSSLTVTGTDCLGGYLNMPSGWNDRVSSTLGYCPRIRHFTGYNKTGSFQDTLSSGNLSSPVNNAVSSIQYIPF